MRLIVDIPEDVYKYKDDEDYVKMCSEEISVALCNAIDLDKTVDNMQRKAEEIDSPWYYIAVADFVKEISDQIKCN